MVLTIRYKGHKNVDYRIDSCLSSSDAEVVSGSEDGIVYIWSLIKVYFFTSNGCFKIVLENCLLNVISCV